MQPQTREVCRFKRPNSAQCKRSVAAGQEFCWQHSHGLRNKVRSLTRNQTILFLLGVASVLIGVIGLYPLVAHKVRVDGNTGLGPPEPNLAVFMRCDMIALPITIPAHTTIHLVPANPRRLKATGWGSYDIPNDADKPEQWPDKHRIDESNKKHNSGVFNYKCDVSNHGQVNVLDIAIPMTVLHSPPRSYCRTKITYTPIISPLDAGQTFTFYFVNDCPITDGQCRPAEFGDLDDCWRDKEAQHETASSWAESYRTDHDVVSYKREMDRRRTL